VTGTEEKHSVLFVGLGVSKGAMVFPQNIGSQNRNRRSTNDSFLCLSLTLNIILLLSILYLGTSHIFQRQDSYRYSEDGSSKGVNLVWHGGRPAQSHPGSCWCDANDKYCMCTPSLAIDVIITTGKNREYLWLVQRRDTNQFATLGGFVELNETTEQAVHREIMEEMSIQLSIHEPPILWGVYSDPRRDNRRHTVSAVYVVHLDIDTIPHAGDDAKDVKRIPMADIEKYEYFADHRTILLDYRNNGLIRDLPVRTTRTVTLVDTGDFATDIVRSTCVPPSPPP